MKKTVSIREIDEALSATDESLFSVLSDNDDFVAAFWRGEPITVSVPRIGNVRVAIVAEVL